MKPYTGTFNRMYRIHWEGDTSPLNIFLVGTTLPNPEFYAPSIDARDSLTTSFYQFEYVTAGRGYMEVDGQEFTLEAGDFFFINHSILRKLRSDKDDPMEKYFITVKGDFADGIVKAYKFTAPYIICKTDVSQYFRNMLDILLEVDEFNPPVANRLSHELLSIVQKVYLENLAFKKQTDSYCSAEDIMRYLDLNISRKVTFKELSEKFFMCKTQLTKIFKAKYGMTPNNYMVTRKIALAKYYLMETDIPISSLHGTLGFSDVKYFSKLFKQHTGQTPSNFRKENYNKKPNYNGTPSLE